MNITRINEFVAKTELGNRLQDLLLSFVSEIKSSKGCQTCQLIRSLENPDKILIIEVWDSQEDHQAAVDNIQGDDIVRVMELLASPPKGEFFSP
ncbi:Antibiotic biosynthesis monooxygenase [compost metagenome]